MQKAYADMGVLDMAGVDLDALMKADEDIADQIDREKATTTASADHELDAMFAEVDAAVADGAS